MLDLVKKKIALKEMFAYYMYRSQLETFTQHQFSANWKIDQPNSLNQWSPENACRVIQDFSENYKCIESDELQSGYFG